MKAHNVIETIQVPAALIDLAKRRTTALVRASIHNTNIIEMIALSCYVQGLTDGYDAAERSQR